MPRSVPLPGSPSPPRVIGPPGRPPGPPPSMVADVAPLAWAAVGTASNRAARAATARTRGFIVGLLPATGVTIDRGTPGGADWFPGLCYDHERSQCWMTRRPSCVRPEHLRQ